MRLDGERSRTGGDIEHGPSAQGDRVEREEAAVFIQRASEKRHGGQIEDGRAGPRPADGQWGWRWGERGHGMMWLVLGWLGWERENKKPDSEESGSGKRGDFLSVYA